MTVTGHTSEWALEAAACDLLWAVHQQKTSRNFDDAQKFAANYSQALVELEDAVARLTAERASNSAKLGEK